MAAARYLVDVQLIHGLWSDLTYLSWGGGFRQAERQSPTDIHSHDQDSDLPGGGAGGATLRQPTFRICAADAK